MSTVELGKALIYEQPTKYIVESTQYHDDYETPVLTAGKSFILGYTNEKESIFNEVPVIIFDDFTTAIKYVDFPFKVKSSAMKILRPNREIADIRYLFYAMSNVEFEADQHKRYWISKYSKIKIPLPPIETQKKIAEALDKADAIRRRNKEMLKKYDDLAQSVFLNMFGDPVKNEKGWEVKTIEQLVTKDKNSMRRGPFGGALKKEIFVKSGYLVYEQYHALNNDFSKERYFITKTKFSELRAFSVKPNDIIISCSGVYLGKLAIVPMNAKEGIINQALLKLTLNKEVVRDRFFVFHFRHTNFKAKYFDSNRGAGIPNFPPMAVFKKFPFISPPIELQIKFEERLKSIELQRMSVQESILKTDELFNCLLQRAFKGELFN